MGTRRPDSPYDFVVEDQEGELVIPCDLLEDNGLVIRVYPTQWLGDHHPALDRFRYQLQAHGLEDPLTAEAWAREYVLRVTTDLSDGLWSIFNHEVHRDDSPDAAQPARQLPAPDGAGQ